MALYICEQHTAYLYDRGGERQLAKLEPLTRVKWERKRDTTTLATIYVAAQSAECKSAVGLLHTGRAELVVFRGGERVWEGPVTRIGRQGDAIEIEARDITHYLNRTAMHNEYDNRYPNNVKVIDRMKRIFEAELARKEALDPPVNILEYVQYLYADIETTDAGTAAHTLPYEMSVWEHLDSYAHRGGIDYATVGRSLLLFDVHKKIGQTPMMTNEDFIGDPIITEYGMELGTRVIMTDGKGNFGAAGGIDPYYGEWEILHQAYDEDAEGTNPEDAPSVAELTSQAQRAYTQGKRPPIVVRIPDNTTLNPEGSLRMADLVPGVWIPLSAELAGQSVSQMQKLDSMTVEENEQGGETIKVTMSPASIDPEAE